jgi:hypothetical protein
VSGPCFLSVAQAMVQNNNTAVLVRCDSLKTRKLLVSFSQPFLCCMCIPLKRQTVNCYALKTLCHQLNAQVYLFHFSLNGTVLDFKLKFSLKILHNMYMVLKSNQ